MPCIAVTAGDPAGIGPDLCLMLSRQSLPLRLFVVADPEVLQQRARQTGMDCRLKIISRVELAGPHQAGQLQVLPVNMPAAVQCGQLNASNSKAVLQQLALAADACLQRQADAMVTAPIHKGIINDAGIPFSGHTEWLAARTGGYPVMMLATEGLRVALATTHLPLREVADAITPQRLKQVVEILHSSLQQDFKLENPRILIAGLNPHAGEDGKLGQEELSIMQPVIEQLRQQGMNVSDPMPADTLFLPQQLQQADAVLAMYHDQGLPVLKHVGFAKAVNITLGLPIIRTSVDHGTALPLAGTGQADPGSLLTAIDTACKLASNNPGRL
ncbi:MAG: 4-hydroxythreonine-4-phosphate dehydrogenase PdxA [gamma proteobacterium symbiont of Bathyaustriella thionipta]|nr:4-hydroxythreonine-4-phosphate dehydrogenase PdxA [gamma proteobacterium symbiont of Bathyaustriella thionipta]